MTDVRAAGKNITFQTTDVGSTQKTSDATSSPALLERSGENTGAVNGIGSSKIDPNVKNKRLAALKSNLLDDYKLTLEQFNYIVKTALNMSEEDIFTCDDKKFVSVVKLVIDSIELLNPENTQDGSGLKEPSERVEEIAGKLKDLYENNDNSIEKTKEVVNKVGTLLDAVKKYGGKEFEKYNSIQEIPTQKLAEVFKKICAELKKSKGTDSGKQSLQQMQNLLITATKEERACVIKASLIALEKSEVGQYIKTQIEKCKTKEAFHELLKKSPIVNAILTFGFSKEEVYELAEKLYEAAKKHCETDEEREAVFNEISSSFNEAIDKQIARRNELEKKKREQGLTEQEQQEYDQLIKAGEDGSSSLENAIAMILANEAKYDPNSARALKIILENSGYKERILKLVAEYIKNHPELNIQKCMDDVTDGEFSQNYGDIVNSGDSSCVSSESAQDYTIGFDLASKDEMLAACDAKDEKQSGLTNTEAPVKYTVEKPGESTANLLTSSFVTMQSFRALVDDIGSFEEAIVKAATRFQKLSYDLRFTVKSFVDGLGTEGALLDFARKCHYNSALISSAIVPNLENSASIDKLKTSFDVKKIAKHNYEQTHGQDEQDEQNSKGIG